jgi:superfamily II DNA or RNA helicase
MPSPTLDDVEQRVSDLLDSAIPPSRIILVEEHPEYRGYLQFEPLDESARGLFYGTYPEWMSRHLILNEVHLADRFVTLLENDGYYVFWTPSTAPIRADIDRWSQPLDIPGYTFRPFQNFSLNRALERARTGTTNSERFYFWNWSAGAGKSFTSGAAARALFDTGDIDLVIACTLSKLKENFRRFFEHAGLDAVVNDGAKAKRRKGYDEDHQVFVMNYEKLWVDEESLAALTAQRRVLFVLDEGHKLITDNGANKARQALDRLTDSCTAIVWPMSATVVGGNPLRFRDVFSLDGRPAHNPLSTKTDFISRYADRIKNVPVQTRNGRSFSFTVYDWNLSALQEVRHRVGDRTMAVRKTDPGVREQFKGIETLAIPVQATPATRELLDLITDRARQANRRGEGLAPFYLLARIACINPEALRHSTSPEAAELLDTRPDLLDAAHSAKIEILNDMLESMREAQDKAVVFCHWTTLGLLPLARHITVPHVLHYGTGQNARESQDAQDRFKNDPDITAFCSSDAGTHGLNLQEARYVINVDPTYSYDDLAQRNARIDRADSHLDGLTAYVLITEDSVEQRVWDVCEDRRQLAAAVQGTQEELSYGVEDRATRDENRNLEWLLFGEE